MIKNIFIVKVKLNYGTIYSKHADWYSSVGKWKNSGFQNPLFFCFYFIFNF